MSSEWRIDVMRTEAHQTEAEEKDWNPQSIYGIHEFTKYNNNIYDPLFVSIGPYHHGKPHLIPMEAHKLRALQHFVRRSNKNIEFYVKEMKSVEQEIRASYERIEDEKWKDSNKFLQLMITDGCFILEFMEILSGAPKDYADNDPIFSYYGSIIHYNVVMRDFLLLENQLPYIVLQKLLIVAEAPQEFPEESANAVLRQMMMFGTQNKEPGAHMLDMYMKGLFRGHNGNNNDNAAPPTASQLFEDAEIKFNKVGSFSEIKFDKADATLHLPPLNINDYTVSTFLNLKTFELRGTTERHFNSYLTLMETLVQSAKDVKLLQSHEIIVNYLGSEEDVVELIKGLGKDTVVDASCPSSLALINMTAYYKESMMKWETEIKKQVLGWILILQETYFSSPWSAISVMAGAFLLALAVIQTIYTVKSSFLKSH